MPFLAWMDAVRGRLFPVALFIGERPAGLLLGMQKPAEEELMLMSIFIEKEHRGNGLSLRMMEFLEGRCRESGISSMMAFYFNGRPFVTAVEGLLDKCGFSPAEPNTFVCVCDKKFINMPMIEYTELPSGFETFKWMDLSAVYRNELRKRWLDEPWFDEKLSPFSDEASIVRDISLGLKKDGKIAGWTICNFIEETKSILYDSVFVMPEYRDAAIGIALQMRSIRGHLLTGLAEKYPFARFLVRYDNHARLKMVKKKFAPYAVEQYDQVIRRKKL